MGEPRQVDAVEAGDAEVLRDAQAELLGGVDDPGGNDVGLGDDGGRAFVLRHVEQGATCDRAALERRPVAGLDSRRVRPEDVTEAEQATDARDVRLGDLHLVVGHGAGPARREHRHGDLSHPTVPERVEVLGDGAPGCALVDAHLGDPAVAGHAGAEHRYAAGGEVLDRGVLARAAEREDDGVEREWGELRHDGLA